MPNIFKSFLRPAVNNYIFPDAESIQMEEPEPEEPAEPMEEPAPAGEDTQRPSGEEERQNAASVISFAKVQADQIVADAHRQAEELMEEGRRKLQEEAETAREEARNDGYRQGYTEGLRQAQVEGARAREEQSRQEAEQVQSFLREASSARDQLLDQAQDDLCELCLAVAEKVIHVSLRTSRDVIARMIQAATEKLKRREWVHIYVGGCEARDLAQITPELTTSLASLSDHIKIIPMADDELGTCLIGMPDEILDAGASTQLENIREAMKEG